MSPGSFVEPLRWVTIDPPIVSLLPQSRNRIYVPFTGFLCQHPRPVTPLAFLGRLSSLDCWFLIHLKTFS